MVGEMLVASWMRLDLALACDDVRAPQARKWCKDLSIDGGKPMTPQQRKVHALLVPMMCCALFVFVVVAHRWAVAS